MFLTNNGTERVLVITNGVVRVDSHNQAIAKGARLKQVGCVPRMEQIKCAAGETDGEMLGAPRLDQREQFINRGNEASLRYFVWIQICFVV